MNADALSMKPSAATAYQAENATERGNSIADFFRYHGFWAPGVRLFRRLGFRAKAMVISATFLVPISLLAMNYFQAQQANIDFSSKERVGVVYARATVPLLQHWLQPQADAAQTQRLMAALAKAQAAMGTELATGTAYDALINAVNASGKPEVQALLDLLGVATDGSNLTLDPDIDTYYLMDAALFRLPVMAWAVAQQRDLPVANQRFLIEQATLLSSNLAALQAGIGKAEAYNAAIKPALRLSEFNAVAAAYTKQLEDTVLRADGAQPLPANAAQAPLEAMFKLFDQSMTELDQLIDARVGRFEADRNITILVTVMSLLFAFYLFSAFRKVLDGGLKGVAFHINAMRDGDLTTSPRSWGADEVAGVMQMLHGMQGSLRQIVGQVRGASDSIVTASSEIASGAQDLSSRTELSAANLEETASAMEQIAATVRTSEDTVAEVTRLAATNAEAADRGGQIIGQVVTTMQGIHKSSGRIGDIIGTIDSIAFQTNILALNAAVEAARAGEQGRGFAVVASEVRALAQRSGAAAREIKTLINESLEQVESGTRVVRDAGTTIQEIVNSAGRVRELLGEVASSSREQTLGVAQSAKSVQELDTATQQNAALVEETAAAAGSLKEQAKLLASEVARFKIDRQHLG